MSTLPLPTTVAISERGVTIESPTRTVAMSRFSERAKRLTLDYGPGTYVLRTTTDVADLPASVLADITEALS